MAQKQTLSGKAGSKYHLKVQADEMKNFEIIIYWSEEDKSFVAEVPELAGCMADGKNPVEAVQNAMVAIDEWIETAKELGRLIPEPKGKLMYA